MREELPGRNFAAVDLGTNSFHLIIAEADNQKFKIVYLDRRVMQLGTVEGEDFKRISDGQIEQTIEILKDFKSKAETHSAEIKIAATSAVRESENKSEFVKRIFDQTGLRVDIIDGINEAELIYLGVQKAFPALTQKIFMIDIGGGSTELLIGQNNKSNFKTSLKIGAVRLTKMFFSDFVLSDNDIKRCEQFIVNQLLPYQKNIEREEFEVCIGCSGTIKAIHSIIKYNFRDFYNINSFTKTDFQKVLELILSRHHPSEREKINGLEKKRVNIIPAGVLIVKNLFDLFNINEMIISPYALREGIIFEMMMKNESKI